MTAHNFFKDSLGYTGFPNKIIRVHNLKSIFLFLNQNICCLYMNSFPTGGNFCHLLISFVNKMLDLIWIQTVLHSDGIPESRLKTFKTTQLATQTMRFKLAVRNIPQFYTQKISPIRLKPYLRLLCPPVDQILIRLKIH